MGRPTNEPVQWIDEREEALTKDFTNLWEISVRDYRWREALRWGIPQAVLDERLEVNVEVDRLLTQLPRLLARHYIILQDLREERDQEQRRQQIL